MSRAMNAQDSFRILSDSQLIERRCFYTSVVWEVEIENNSGVEFGYISGSRSRFIPSPPFQCSNHSLNLSYHPIEDIYSHPPYIYLNLVDGDSSILIRYFKLIISDSTKWVVFECASENRLIGFGEKHIKITINTKHNEVLGNLNSIIISFDLYLEDPFQPEKIKELKAEIKRPVLTAFESAACSDLEVFCNNRRLSDVTLKLADDVEFQAHKLVLCARSKVFAAMFEHDTKEKQSDTVNLVEMEVKTVEDMLRYLYCGKVRELSPEDALNLFVAADRYDLQELKNFCREVVLNGISTSNVCNVAAVADLHDDEILIRKLKSFLFENGKEVIKTEKWKAITSKNPSLGSKMFEWIFSE